jgi:hypothetical protein
LFTSFFLENIGFARVTRLRASPRHGGAGRCYRIFSGIDPPRGRPTGAAALILKENREGGFQLLNKTSRRNPDANSSFKTVSFENILSGVSTPQALSGTRRGTPGPGDFPELLVTNPPRGFPLRVAAVIPTLIQMGRQFDVHIICMTLGIGSFQIFRKNNFPEPEFSLYMANKPTSSPF